VSLAWACEVCGRPRKKPCVWPLQRIGDTSPPQPLVGGGEHLARVLPPGRTKPAKEDRDG
jgi:hypothetical protein